MLLGVRLQAVAPGTSVNEMGGGDLGSRHYPDFDEVKAFLDNLISVAEEREMRVLAADCAFIREEADVNG